MTGLRPAERGFTLAELLVALFIFGVISAAGVALLAFSADSQAGSQRALAANDDIRRMNAALGNDLLQAVSRVSRDEAGVMQNAFFGGSGEDSDLLLGFVRRGWANHDGAPRSSLQKVDYRLVEGRLERRAYPHVDGAEPRVPAILLSGVENVRLRYRVADEWRDRWDPTDPSAMPSAVEAVVEIEGMGAIRQLLQVGGGA